MLLVLLALVTNACASYPMVRDIKDVSVTETYEITKGQYRDCTMKVFKIEAVVDMDNYNFEVREQVCGTITCDDARLYFVKCLPIDDMKTNFSELRSNLMVK